MNDLQQARKLLEDKINLTNSLIARKKKDFDYHSKEADEIQLAIEALIVEKWKDQEALKAVNEEISQIPTLAVQKTNPLWETFKIGLAFLLLTSLTFISCSLNKPKYYVTQGFDGGYISPSCGSFQTDVWYSDQLGPKIIRAWFDNGCLLSDSLIQKRLDDANAIATMLNKTLNK